MFVSHNSKLLIFASTSLDKNNNYFFDNSVLFLFHMVFFKRYISSKKQKLRLASNKNNTKFQDSETYSPMMDAPIAHIISTAYLALTLHFIDRQTEYLNRLDLKWNTELESEQTQIANRRYANRILLDNILPAHVCK